jgi:hypothetical protein
MTRSAWVFAVLVVAVALAHVGGQVGAELRVDDGSFRRQRRLQIHHRLQRLVIDDHHVRRASSAM